MGLFVSPHGVRYQTPHRFTTMLFIVIFVVLSHVLNYYMWITGYFNCISFTFIYSSINLSSLPSVSFCLPFNFSPSSFFSMASFYSFPSFSFCSLPSFSSLHSFSSSFLFSFSPSVYSFVFFLCFAFSHITNNSLQFTILSEGRAAATFVYYLTFTISTCRIFSTVLFATLCCIFMPFVM